ncbi:hypothetical protein DDB_G0288587 [Dictyostelium discoideum AX4]|uniref:Uncharacterized protein n=1 Tax=Dictyostelium discoideum TaxID=44689 RepID=Q54IQ6_DICDI|nr:hypothetical protein DDB_G0288587 [Dictyostelium discoideum AX4]EAL63153.1 hypothetical protein DDB_G0288587 [Dictyostelium discoideum AX4]|eukprot:XP_636658.1 hypothetical protein DDB_G0288587 [Dictyostelium discoideum AX4]
MSKPDESYEDLNEDYKKIKYETKIKNKEIYNLSLVSKQFFKVLSKKLEDKTFPLFVPILDQNGKRSFDYKPPKVFHYETIKQVKYNSTKYEFFSVVDIFTIDFTKCDDFDKKHITPIIISQLLLPTLPSLKYTNIENILPNSSSNRYRFYIIFDFYTAIEEIKLSFLFQAKDSDYDRQSKLKYFFNSIWLLIKRKSKKNQIKFQVKLCMHKDTHFERYFNSLTDISKNQIKVTLIYI